LDVNGINGTMVISAIDTTGNLNGNMIIDYNIKLNGAIICPKEHPCSIKGSYDGKSVIYFYFYTNC
jgi:hypothetical protein